MAASCCLSDASAIASASSARSAWSIRYLPAANAEILANLDLPIQLFSEGNREGTRGSVRTSEVRVEPNPIAAMPSIHLAATVIWLN